MPYATDVLEAMKKKYGEKKGVGVYIGWQKNHPQAEAKARATAARPGHGGITPHTSKGGSRTVRRMMAKGKKSDA